MSGRGSRIRRKGIMKSYSTHISSISSFNISNCHLTGCPFHRFQFYDRCKNNWPDFFRRITLPVVFTGFSSGWMLHFHSMISPRQLGFNGYLNFTSSGRRMQYLITHYLVNEALFCQHNKYSHLIFSSPDARKKLQLIGSETFFHHFEEIHFLHGIYRKVDLDLSKLLTNREKLFHLAIYLHFSFNIFIISQIR